MTMGTPMIPGAAMIPERSVYVPQQPGMFVSIMR
jgi:hypothetical protein